MAMQKLVAVSSLTIGLLWTHHAQAQLLPIARSDAETAERGVATDQPNGRAEAGRWYGYQLALADAATVALLLTADFESALPLGIGMFAVNAPLVHTLNGNPGRGLGSLSLRIGLPVLGVLVARTSDDETRGLLGASIGAGLAVLIDYTILGYEPESRKGKSMFVSPTDGGATVGFAGGF